MDFRDIHKSQKVRGILIGLGVAVLALVIFQAGVSVGFKKATFGHRLGDNFERNFKDPRGGDFGGGFPAQGMPGGHGAVGKIVSIALPLIVVAGPDNLEKTLVINEDTEIREFRDTITKDKLQVGNFIIVLGTPNDLGQIEAKLIRLAPAPKNNL